MTTHGSSPLQNEDEQALSGNHTPQQKGSQTPEHSPISRLHTPPEVKEYYKQAGNSSNTSTSAARVVPTEDKADKIASNFIKNFGEQYSGVMMEIIKKIESIEQNTAKGEQATTNLSTKIALFQERHMSDSGYFVKKFREIAEVANKMHKVGDDCYKSHQEWKQESKDIIARLMKLETHSEDTRQLILQQRHSSINELNEGYPQSPSLHQDRNHPMTPHQSPNRQQQEDQRSSHDKENRKHCPFCDRNNHRAQDCKKVVDYKERRTTITSKDKCFLCLEQRHEKGKECPESQLTCHKCAYKYFKDPQNEGCKHHPALCEEGNHGSSKRFAPYPTPQPRGFKEPRTHSGSSQSRRGGYRGYQ